MNAGAALATLTFAAPQLAMAAAATGLLPILIHLIHRRRHRRIQWAAMRFLLAANRRSMRRARLEQWLLLVLRTLVIVLLGLAVAGPSLVDSPFAGSPSVPTLRVVLLDDSCSMRAQQRVEEGGWRVAHGKSGSGSASRFALAKQDVEALLDSFPRRDPVAVITLAAPEAEVAVQPTRDRRLLRDRLNSIAVTQRGTDLAGGLRLALELIEQAKTEAADATVYVISDMARTTWSSEAEGGVSYYDDLRIVDGTATAPASDDHAREQSSDGVHGSPTVAVQFARRIGQRASLVLVAPRTTRHKPNGSDSPKLHDAAPETLANVSVTNLSSLSAVVASDEPARFVAEVTNFGTNDVRDGVLQIRRAGRIIRRIPIPLLEPGQVRPVRFSVVFDAPGLHELQAKFDPARPGDALTIDNTRYLAVEVRESLPVLLVDGQPEDRGTRVGGAAGYLATAIAPRTESNPDTFVNAAVVGPYELSGEVLEDYAIVVLCDVRQLAPAEWRRIADYVRRGHGLMVFMGDAVDLDHYNRFAFANGEGVLPASLGRVVSDETRADAFFVRFKHEPFMRSAVADFATAADSGLFLARIRKYVQTSPDPDGATVLLRFAGLPAADPAIVAKRFGAGTVCLVTTTANMDWTNLPAKGDYVSLMMNLVAYLVPSREGGRNVIVGEPLVEPLGRTAALGGLSDVRASGPEGATTPVPELRPVAGGLSCRVASTERAGFYAVDMGEESLLFAANVDPTESDLAVFDREAFASAFGELGSRFTVSAGVDELTSEAPTPQAQAAVDASLPILYVVLVLLLCEAWLAKRLSPRC